MTNPVVHSWNFPIHPRSRQAVLPACFLTPMGKNVRCVGTGHSNPATVTIETVTMVTVTT